MKYNWSLGMDDRHSNQGKHRSLPMVASVIILISDHNISFSFSFLSGCSDNMYCFFIQNIQKFLSQQWTCPKTFLIWIWNLAIPTTIEFPLCAPISRTGYIFFWHSAKENFTRKIFFLNLKQAFSTIDDQCIPLHDPVQQTSCVLH